jgi:hypothetical protein
VSPSRIDSFSDVVFGFALTLIVVSQAVPHTYDELRAVLLAFPAFSVCFLLFVVIWLSHYRFFRRYGLHDTATLWINFALLFNVLFYVYPLKFLFAVAVGYTPAGVFTNPYQPREMMIVYGAGYAAINFLFAGLYANAWRQRLHLRLNPVEVTITSLSFWNYIVTASIGLLCCLLARILPLDQAGSAGYGFFLLLVWGRAEAFISRRYLRDARARLTAEDHHAVSVRF